MSIKVAINGFGRIGRLAFRRAFEDKDFKIVAINDLSSTANLAYLLKYDSAHGTWNHEVSSDESNIIVDGKKIPVYKIKTPTDDALFPWKALKVDVVLECSGHYLTKELSNWHIKSGAKGVVLSAPAKDDTPTYVYGVNTDKLGTENKIISGASCTTNCLGPVLKVVEDNWGIEAGFMTTVHAYTNDQTNLDLIKEKDFRRGRAAAQNIVPTSTGAAKAIFLVIPSLKGRMQGGAIRVPVLDGSLIDVTLVLKKKVEGDDKAAVALINSKMKEASEGELKDVLGYTDDPIVSRDILGRTEGSIYNGDQTKVFTDPEGHQLVKVFSWYDNEYSYTCQYVRLAKLFGQKLAK